MPILTGYSLVRASRDDNGDRSYTIRCNIETGVGEGPFSIWSSGILPAPGDLYSLTIDGTDEWATCKQASDIVAKGGEEPTNLWYCDILFSTKGDEKRCKDEVIEDPLLIPQEVNGEGINFMEEATEDRFGNKLLTSSHEMIRGAQAEFEVVRHTIVIQQNVPALELELWNPMQNTVNEEELWGAPRRCIKMGVVKWGKKYWGACEAYYTRRFQFDVFIKVFPGLSSAISATTINPGAGYEVGEFITIAGGEFKDPVILVVLSIAVGGLVGDVVVYSPGKYSTTPTNPASEDHTSGIGAGATFNINYETYRCSGHDRDLLDEGTKVLNGYWTASGHYQTLFIDEDGTIDPDPTNPSHFILFTDRQGNPARVILNGAGLPADVFLGEGTGTDDPSGEPGNIHVERYGESDFTQLNIPLVL